MTNTQTTATPNNDQDNQKNVPGQQPDKSNEKKPENGPNAPAGAPGADKA